MPPKFPPDTCCFCRGNLFVVKFCRTCDATRNLKHKSAGTERGVACVYWCSSCEQNIARTRTISPVVPVDNVSSTTTTG